MKQYVTDLGTLALIHDMNAGGRANLEHFLEGCDRYGRNRTTFGRHMFEGWPRLESMEMEYDSNDRREGRVLTTVSFDNALWRRGSLRIPGIELPQTIMAGIKGRRIGDLVENSPFPDFIINHAVHDRKAGSVTLRIRSTGEELAPIPRR